MNITVCCCTFRRPVLLGYMIRCFERQTHPARRLVILDDSGQLEGQEGPRWKIVSHPERYPTLGAKRNACARLADPRTDALVFWDDDDLFFPWGLAATDAALQRAPWSRPSQYCLWDKKNSLLRRHLTWHRPDRRDKACQGGWGISQEMFWRAGGYPEHLTVGEDKQLALRLEAAGAAECDPIEEFGFRPWYVWGPWGNTHVSESRVQYATFDGGCRRVAGDHAACSTREPRFGAEDGRVTASDPPGIPLGVPVFAERIERRPWGGDWYEDVER